MYYDIIIIYIYIFVIYCYHALAYQNEMLNSNNSQQYNQRLQYERQSLTELSVLVVPQ